MNAQVLWFENKNKKRIPFSEVQIGTRFNFAEEECMRIQPGLTTPILQINGVEAQPCEFNFVFLNTGRLSWLSPDQHVEVIAPHREDS